MKFISFLPALICIAWLLSSCASRKPYYEDPPAFLPGQYEDLSSAGVKYSLFLTGNTSLDNPTPVMTSIRKAPGAELSGLVLLGDVLNVADGPFPLEDSLLSLDRRYHHFFVVPGQAEWSHGNKVSHKALGALDARWKDIKNKGRLILPSKGCGTPEIVPLTDHTLLVLVDSQWAIDAAARPDEKKTDCELASILEWRQAIREIVQAHPEDHIIIATHHPVYTNGPTAGNYPLSSHLLPLPILGTVITGIKSMVASSQHFGHPAYEAYRSALTSAISGCTQCIVVSGHEKSMQYYYRGGQHFFVAGSGSSIRHARRGERSGFSYMSLGYLRADELPDASLRLSFVAVDDAGASRIVWETEVTPPRRASKNIGDTAHDIVPFVGDSIRNQASVRYSRKKFLRGDFYRHAWSQQINMPVLWLDKIHGGLKPVQLGGGNQTRSLRMENDRGEQFVIRSIDKKVTNVLPLALRGTFAENIVQDGIAASHPYGALVIPALARAANVFYTNPSIVYVPHQDALGIYNEDVGDGVYLFEERPGGETRGFVNFGNTEETISTSDLLERIAESPKHVADQRSALRARLFDVWLGDWDRHDDQWRWAVFEEGDRNLYRPIPRDRDQVFFNNDGLLDYLASRPYFNPPLRRFGDKIDYLEGLIWAGKYFDRSFLHALTREDFVTVAQELQSGLTDDVIENAFLDWPREVDQWDGDRLRRSLRIRRDDLKEYANAYYDHLAEEVSIACTEDRDVITIRGLNDEQLEVRVVRVNKEGPDQVFYERTFNDIETHEIRVFGLSKTDSISLSGSGNPSIRIRIIGGSGEDVVVNENKALRVQVYDEPAGVVIEGEAVRETINQRPFNNVYDRMDWHLNRTFHFPAPAYFTDEGFGLSYHLWALRHGFRADPHKSKHIAGLSYFFSTGSFIGRYYGEWRNTFGSLDFGLNAFVTGPTFTQYYYGLGNTYVAYNEKTRYHIVKGSQLLLSPSLRKSFGFGSTISLSTSFQYIDMEDGNETPRFIYTPASGLTSADFGSRYYAGVNLAYSFERLDNAGYPTRGADLTVSVGGRMSIGDVNIHHGMMSGEGSLYIPFDVTGAIVLATHVRADKIYGEYEFFHALTLGGRDKLRGFRMDRFAGEARFLHATDLRIRLFNSRGVIPFGFGIYGSFDHGRVWFDGDAEADQQWHTAIGGGIFIVPLQLAAFRLGYMVGEGDRQINIGGALRF